MSANLGKYLSRAAFPLWMGLGFVLALANPAKAQENAAAFFKQNCSACHTIGGGKLLGPDLKGITKARNHEDLEEWLINPQAVIDRGDPYALKLKKEYGGIVMPTVPGMTLQAADSLLTFIDAETARASGAVAAPVVVVPFTAAQVAEGRALFLGRQSLEGGGAACVSCHAVRSTGGVLGGGRLGPDLTLVYQRLEGRRNVEAWLTSPASATMKPIFTGHPLKPGEIGSLTAFFERAAKEPGIENAGMYRLRFALLGLGGAALGLLVLGLVWRRRIRGVRRALVEGRLKI